MIVPPRRPSDDPVRATDCQDALEAEFQSIAISASWSESEVELAMLCLSLAEIRRPECNRETEEQILAAIRTVEGK